MTPPYDPAPDLELLKEHEEDLRAFIEDWLADHSVQLCMWEAVMAELHCQSTLAKLLVSAITHPPEISTKPFLDRLIAAAPSFERLVSLAGRIDTLSATHEEVFGGVIDVLIDNSVVEAALRLFKHRLKQSAEQKQAERLRSAQRFAGKLLTPETGLEPPGRE